MSEIIITITGKKSLTPYFNFIKELENSFQLREYSFPTNESADLILACGTDGLMEATKLKSYINAPILYMISSLKIDISNIFNFSLFNEIIVINESLGKGFSNFIRSEFSTVLYPLIDNVLNELPCSTLSKKKSLLFYFRNKEFINFFQLLEAINTLSFSLGVNVNVVFDSKVETYLNENVKLYPSTEIDLLLQNCDIIIGHGQIAKRSIICGKPTIVVGPYGYGGIVTEENIYYLDKYNFNGRPGGYFNEPIPINLIVNDIITINGTNPTKLLANLKRNRDFLILQNEKIINSFIEIITDVVKSFKEEINLNTKLFKSSLYKIIKSSDDYFLINSKTNQIHSIMGKEEYEIIDFFKNEKTISSLQQVTKETLSEEDLLEFIKELIDEKVLYTQ